MKKIIAFYPVLYAFFPALFLYSHNIEEVSLRVAFIPMLVCLGVTFFIGLIFMFSIKDKQKAAFLTFLLIFMVFSYGHFVNLINNTVFKKIDIPAICLIIFWVVLFMSISILTMKKRRKMDNITMFLNISVAALMLFSLFKIAIFNLENRNYPKPKKEISEDLRLSSGMSLRQNDLPDIYYLIFDRYANSNTLQEYYGFDNSDFLDYLRGKGFYIAQESKNNYPGSDLSLSSSLNMEYLNYLLEKGPIKRRVIYQLLQDFKVWRLLKSVGYTYIHFGSWWEPTRTNKYADYNFKAKGLINLSRDFYIKFLETTILTHFSKKELVSISGRERILKKFEELAKIPEWKGPKFIFSHFLIPHHPFIFDENGEDPRTKAKKSREESYIAQLKFVNKKIEWLIDEILKNSKNPPIIIVQSDEGPGNDELPAFELAKFSGIKRLKMMYRITRRILNAYYLPGVDNNVLYETVTPINTFRLIFNLYFGTNYELLEDVSYTPKRDRYFYRKFELVSPNMFIQ